MSTRELRREFRDGRGLFNEVIGGVGDLIGAGHRIRGDVGRDRAYGYNSAYRGDVAQDRYRDYRDRRDGDRDDDRRAAPYSGRGGQGPRGFSGGQGRGDARGGQGQGQDPRIQATEDYVYALADAAQSPAGSPERTAAMQRARDILTNPENGLIQSDRSVRFPEGMRVPLNSNSYIHFEGIDSRATSPEVSIQKGVNAVAGQRIGTPLTDADIATLRGTAAPAGATVPVGTGAPATGTPAPSAPAPDAPATGTPAPAAPTATTFTLPPASGPEAQIYTRNRAGRTMNADDAPKMSANQVEAIQRELGVQADGKWGPDTQAAFARAAQAAGVNPRDVDFTNPNDPETVRVLAQFNAPAAGAAVAPQAAPQVAAGGSPAPAVTTDAPAAPGAAAPDAARLAAAVNVLSAVAGSDNEVSAGNISAIQSNAELTTRIGRAFDLNNNGRVEEAELNQIVVAAAAKPEAERVTVAGGVAALNPLFAGTSFASVQPTTDVASVTPPAPGLAQTAQVSPQTGEVTPPAAAPASVPLRTENAVYIVPEQTFEPSSQGVPTAQGFVRGGGVTIA